MDILTGKINKDDIIILDDKYNVIFEKQSNLSIFYNENVELIKSIMRIDTGELNEKEIETEKLLLNYNSNIHDIRFVVLYYWITDLNLSLLSKALNGDRIYNSKEFKDTVKYKLHIKRFCKVCKSEMIITEVYHKGGLRRISTRVDRDDVIRQQYSVPDCICQNCKDRNQAAKTKNKEIKREQIIPLEVKSSNLDNLKTMPYKEYLKTEHWKITRAKSLKKANYKCELCNSNKDLNVHHKTYENRGEEKPEDLIVLCRDCHSKFHDKFIEEDIKVEVAAPVMKIGKPIIITLKRIRDIQMNISDSFQDFTELPIELIEEYNKLITSKIM